MKFDVPGVSPPLLPGSDKDDYPPGSMAAPSSEATAVTSNALRISATYLIGAVIALGGEVVLAFQSPSWQLFMIAGIGFILVVVAAISIRLVRQDHPRAGIRVLIGFSLASVFAASFMVAGIGLILGLGTIFLVLTTALQTLSKKEANWALFISVGVALTAGGVDLASPVSQLNFPIFRTLILVLGGVTILVYGILTVRQFGAYPLTTKLILAFLAVSLIPLAALAFLNDQETRAVLIEQAEQSLLAAVSTTAANVDNFINNNLETIRVEAQLPVLADYIRLSPEQRAGSNQEAAAIATLNELSRKDKIFIASYGLLDDQGQNLIDTYPPNTGQDEAAHLYFQKPVETGLPYLSSVEFLPLLTEANPGDKSQQPAEAAMYFSSPIRDAETDEILGVLRVRYKTSILQKLIVQNNGLVGEQSFAIMFDENYFRLAHGAAPELIFRSVVPLTSTEIAKLQAASRLPHLPEDQLSTNLPELAAKLDNAIFEPTFTTRSEPTGDKINLAVVKELETQPWLVVFAQPQDIFLTPIQDQTRTALFLAIIIAGLMAAAAFAVGQLLASPLVHLTQTVTQFTAGNLDARAQLKSSDESGVLAKSFNLMAEQVGNLLKSLAERTRDLENEIGERQRAEADLQASEKKYRALFEESNDAIFITTMEGRIVDVNPAALALLGYTRDEIMQINAVDVYARQDDVVRFLREIARQRSVSDFEVKFCRKDDTQIDCLLTAAVRQAEDGTILGYQGIIRDITAQKQSEKERLRLSAIERELTLAQEIQHRLLPPVYPAWASLDVVCYSIPAREMGGDFYAYHAFDQESAAKGTINQNLDFQSAGSNSSSAKYAVAVGDVSGKGMPAALLMAVSLASFQSIIGQSFAPSDLLTHLDQIIVPYTRTTRQNCAMVYLEILFPAAGASAYARVANAGCIMPIIRRIDGTVAWLEAVGTPLGVVLGSELGYPYVELSLSKGDVIVLVSDGVVEAKNGSGNLFGFERLEQAVASGPSSNAEAILEHLKYEIMTFVGNTEPHDDLTVVVVRV